MKNVVNFLILGDLYYKSLFIKRLIRFGIRPLLTTRSSISS